MREPLRVKTLLRQIVLLCYGAVSERLLLAALITTWVGAGAIALATIEGEAIGRAADRIGAVSAGVHTEPGIPDTLTE